MKYLVVFLIFFIHTVLLLNTQFTLWPEMVVYPYLLNNGFLLYKDIINPYPPSLTYVLSIFTNLFGYNPSNFKYLTIIIILLTDFLIFYFSLKIFKKLHAALISVLFFIVFSIPFGVNGLWFDLVQSPLIVTSIYFLAKYAGDKKNKFITYAFIFALAAFFIKQQAVWYLLYLCVATLFFQKGNYSKTISALKLPALFTITIVFTHILFLASKNIFGDFINWGIFFSSKSTTLPGYILFPTGKQLFSFVAIVLLTSPAFFLNLKKKVKALAFVVPALILFAYPRFDYFHLVPALAVLSLIIPFLFFKSLGNKFIKPLSIVGIILLITFAVKQYKEDWGKEIRFFEEDTISSAKILKDSVPVEGSLYMQNSPDQFLVLTNKIPPKPWADDFPWYLENNYLQEEIISGIKNENVEYILSQAYTSGSTYQLGAYRPQKIAEYLENNYTIIETLPNGLEIKKRNGK